MAKDDYDYIVFKTLVYLYGVFQRKYSFEECAFKTKIGDIDPEYLSDVLRMMQNDGLISGLLFIRAWSNDYILANDLFNMKITSSGIHYLKENSSMQKAKSFILESPGMLADLIKLVLGIC